LGGSDQVKKQELAKEFSYKPFPNLSYTEMANNPHYEEKGSSSKITSFAIVPPERIWQNLHPSPSRV